MLQLCEPGLVNLDAPAGEYLRAYRLIPAKPGHRPPTIRQLLTHTAGYVWMIAALNALAWLSRIVAALATGGQAGFLRGTGLPTSPVYVRDLALWLPLTAVAAAWLWRRSAWGFLIIGGALVMWVLESASIAVDQWYGHAADPASPVASVALTTVFGLLALIGLVPVYYLLRSLDRGPSGHPVADHIPVAGHRSWPAWILAGMLLVVGAAGSSAASRWCGTGLGCR